MHLHRRVLESSGFLGFLGSRIEEKGETGAHLQQLAARNMLHGPPLDKFPYLARPQWPETLTVAKRSGKSAGTRLHTLIAGQPSHIRAAPASPRIECFSAWCGAPPQAPLPSGVTSSVTLLHTTRIPTTNLRRMPALLQPQLQLQHFRGPLEPAAFKFKHVQTMEVRIEAMPSPGSSRPRGSALPALSGCSPPRCSKHRPIAQETCTVAPVSEL